MRNYATLRHNPIIRKTLPTRTGSRFNLPDSAITGHKVDKERNLAYLAAKLHSLPVGSVIG